MMRFEPFRPGAATQTINVNATSQSVTLPGALPQVELQNDGASACFVRVGASPQTAVTTDYPILPGQSKIITVETQAGVLAAVCAAGGTATLYVTPGWGY